MKGLFIRGMDMPERCIDCPFLDDNDNCKLQPNEQGAYTWGALRKSCPIELLSVSPPVSEDTISRQAAIDELDKGAWGVEWDKALAKAMIESLPSAQPERKKGEWLPQDHNKRTGYVTTTVYYYPKCSECGHTGNYGMNYCPSCGADMRGKIE